MELAAQIGISITEFWQITPFELSIAAKGYSKRLDADTEIITQTNIIQAFLISRWVWQKRVDIKKYLNTKNKKKTMTDKEMLEQVKVLNNLLGGNVVTERRDC